MALNNFGLGFQVFAEDVASKVFEKVRGELGKTEGAAKGVNVTLGDLKGEFQAWGARFTQLGQAGVGAMSAALAEATKFGKSVGEVASITDRATFPLSEIERIGKEMASTYGGDLNLQVKTLYQAVSSGASNVAEATALMHAANKLAVGGLSDSFKAVDALTNVLNAYGMKMGEADKVSDALFTTAKIGKTTIDELASQIGRVAPTAAAMGVSMDDLMAAITAGSTQLGNASAAIDGMKEAMSGILKPTSDAAAEAQRLGIKFDAATLRSKGFNQFLKDITQNAKFNKDTIGKLFGSMTAFNTMSVLASNGGKAFADALEGMEKKAGATDYAFNTLAQTGEFASSVFKANLQTAMASLGAVIAPLIGKLLVFANTILQKFNKASPVVHKFVAVFISVGSAAALMLGGLLGAAGAIAGLVIAGKALLIGLAAVAGAFALIMAAVLPIIAIGTTLYIMWTKDIGGLATKVTHWFERIKLAFNALAQVFSDGAFSGELQAELSKAENQGIKQFAINAFLWFNRIKNFFVNIGEAFEQGIARVGPIVERISAVIERLASRFGATKDAASKNKEAFEAWGGAGRKVGDFLVTVVEKVALWFEKAITFIDGAVETFQKFKPTIDAVWSAVSDLGEAFGSLIAAVVGGNTAGDASAATWGEVGKVLGWFLTNAVQSVVTGMHLLAGVIQWVSGLIGGMRTLFSGVVNAVIIGAQMIWAILTGDFKGAWKLAGDMVDNWVKTVIGLFTKVVGGAAGMVDSLGKLFGADLGLKAKVEAVGASATPSNPALPPPPANTPTAGSAPAVAAAGAQATQSAAAFDALKKSQGGAPTEVTVKSQIVLDGQVVGEAVQKANTQSTGRGFAPVPAPT